MLARYLPLAALALAGCSGSANAPYETVGMRPAPAVDTRSVANAPTGTPGPGLGTYGDATTTAAGLSQGFVEANPLLSPCGPAAPVCSIALKQVAKEALIETGMDPVEAHRGIEAGGWLGTCANVATLAGAAPVVAVGIGAGCAVASLGGGSVGGAPYERLPE